MSWDRPSLEKSSSIFVPSRVVAIRPPKLRVCIKITCKKYCKRIFSFLNIKSRNLTENLGIQERYAYKKEIDIEQ